MIRSGIDFKPSVSLHVHKIKANHEKLHDEHSQRRFCICLVNSERLYDSIRLHHGLSVACEIVFETTPF